MEKEPRSKLFKTGKYKIFDFMKGQKSQYFHLSQKSTKDDFNANLKNNSKKRIKIIDSVKILHCNFYYVERFPT